MLDKKYFRLKCQNKKINDFILMPGLQADEINREVIIFNLLCNRLQRAFNFQVI
jgi:hypothetical protein